MKILSPDATYTGESRYGETVLNFEDGAAEVKDLPHAVRSYLQGAGYKVEAPKPRRTPAPKPDSE
jgi:hypothetical protein